MAHRGRRVLQIDDDQARLARDTEKGHTRCVAEFYGHVWGNDFHVNKPRRCLCSCTRFLKILVVSRTHVPTTRGRWLSSVFGLFLATVQTGFREAGSSCSRLSKRRKTTRLRRDRGPCTRGGRSGRSSSPQFSLLFPSAACSSKRRVLRGRAKSAVRCRGNAGGDDAENRASKREAPRCAKKPRRERRDFQPQSEPRDDGFLPSSSLRSRETRRRTTPPPLPRAIPARFRPSAWTPKRARRDETRGERGLRERRRRKTRFVARAAFGRRSSSYFSMHDMTPARQNAFVFNQHGVNVGYANAPNSSTYSTR